MSRPEAHRLTQLVERLVADTGWRHAPPPPAVPHVGRDVLTGLRDRTAFVDRLRGALDGLAGDARATVLLIDLDDFQGVNGAVGHACGDRVLAAAAERLGAIAPIDATIARLDGDEFALLLPTCPSTADALAARALASLAAPYDVDAPDGAPVRLTASVGLVVVGPGAVVDDVLRHAALAMRRAKSTGGGRLERFADAMDTAARDRRALAGDLRMAIERNELHVVYQPIVALEDGAAAGVEALMRWQHPDRGPVSPATFIPVVEEIGLASAFGRWVLREACRAIASIDRSLYVSVNVSGRQLDDERFPDDVADVLDETGLAPERLVLEITETALVREPRRARRVLGELRTLGVSIAIDDFGTGYSSLSYLQQLPLDVLKVDRSFVIELTAGVGPGQSFARTIVALGQALGLRTVAEGVETATQRDALRAMGCSHAQGYHFARPLPPAELLTWLDANLVSVG